ncbi:ankyrin repeat-containing protein ITN1-like [Neltuma alba]|uniref:ankyrin repeat-containing protein ITN1-like n=1 Tax=Neltuma alba TaxID=207710 RepID=UPI0010A4CA48|nr:ankyrin repeat-containing protein ITN1-like [Prosopis alba]
MDGYDSFELLRPSSDLETGQQNDAKPPASVFVGIDSLWKRKKHHQLAERLAKFLVKHDYSWQISYNHIKKTLVVLPSVVYNVAKRKKQVERKEKKRQEKQDLLDDDHDQDPNKQAGEKHPYDNHTPLLVAASNGIIEIVQLFLEEHPESVNHVSEDEQNLLHMAVKHRQLEIFKLLKKNPSFGTLVTRISREKRTALHQVARMDYYRASHHAGAAFQLQAELKWYKRVAEVVPNHLHLHCDYLRLTAGDVLDIEHDNMLADAQSWIKQTAESCSTVSVLVATVVFAAAYTIPGGSEGGTPVYLRSPVFIFFTVMDIVALAFSLASVVMFLSILTSPFELWDFHRSLPRKLNIGFAFLFCSLTTTMLAFSATILLTIRLQWKQWTSTLVYSAAFFPVTIFGLIEFPLYMMLPSLICKVYKKIMKVIPINRAGKHCCCRGNQRAKYP